MGSKVAERLKKKKNKPENNFTGYTRRATFMNFCHSMEISAILTVFNAATARNSSTPPNTMKKNNV